MGKIKILFFTLCFLNIAILSAESRVQNRQSAPTMHQRISQDSIKSTENAISLEKPTQSLESYIALAKQNYPLYANTALLESAKNLSLEKINLHFIPHFKIADLPCQIQGSYFYSMKALHV